MTALVDVGLHIEFVHEHPWCFYQHFGAMEEDDRGRWWLPELENDLPFTFSLKARNSAEPASPAR